MDLKELLAIRLRWLTAARIYYLSAGEDSGMSDSIWDYYGRELFANRSQLPGCPVLNDPRYEGGSLFWVNEALYEKALAADPLKAPSGDDFELPAKACDLGRPDICESCQ